MDPPQLANRVGEQSVEHLVVVLQRGSDSRFDGVEHGWRLQPPGASRVLARHLYRDDDAEQLGVREALHGAQCSRTPATDVHQERERVRAVTHAFTQNLTKGATFAYDGMRTMTIRPARDDDREAIWLVLAPTIGAGETYPLPRDMSQQDALDYWFGAGHEVFVADESGIAGTYYLRANQRGGGAHVANCGYMVAPHARGRGVGRLMCEHSLDRARQRGFRAMQFNFVVSTNDSAVRLWQACGFTIVGRLPRAFDHPSHGPVDALVMFRTL